MKILHVADLHLGKMIFGRSMLEDQQYFIENILLPAVMEEQPDCVTIGGDVFDRSVAPTGALELFDRLITSLAGQTETVIISGNHDGAARMSIGAQLMERAGVHIRTSLTGCDKPVIITGRDGRRAAIYALPYFDHSQAREFLGMDEQKEYDKLFAEITGRMDVSDKETAHVLLAHCITLGSASCDSESGSMVGGSNEVPLSCFEKFDCTLLGHLHSPQHFGPHIAYAGSPLRYSFDKAERDKAMLVAEITDGACSIRRLPIAPLRCMRVIRGTIEQLLTEQSDDYCFAELCDRQLIFEPMYQLREKYPNILGMKYAETEAVGDSGSERSELRGKLRDRSLGDNEVLDAFMRQMCGVVPDENDAAVFARLCEMADNAEVQR